MGGLIKFTAALEGKVRYGLGGMLWNMFGGMLRNGGMMSQRMREMKATQKTTGVLEVGDAVPEHDVIGGPRSGNSFIT